MSSQIVYYYSILLTAKQQRSIDKKVEMNRKALFPKYILKKIFKYRKIFGNKNKTINFINKIGKSIYKITQVVYNSGFIKQIKVFFVTVVIAAQFIVSMFGSPQKPSVPEFPPTQIEQRLQHSEQIHLY